jgi:putative sugar O-methyltransferase
MRIALNRQLRRLDLGVYRVSEVERGHEAIVHGSDALPEGAAEALSGDNPRLSELEKAYKNHPAFDLSVWSNFWLRDQLDLKYFRGDNQYVYQARGTTELSYRLSYDVAREADKLGLFSVLAEDGSFGALTFDVDGVTISRDLIDSVLEINFLAEVLGVDALKTANLIDIGAGYGRLSHRLLSWSPRATVTSTDAVPISTFLSEYFLKDYLGLAGAAVAPLHEAERVIKEGSFNLATNIHSWPEATSKSVRWWIGQLADADVQQLFIVHGRTELCATSHRMKAEPLDPILSSFGYRLGEVRPKYKSSVLAQRLAAFPAHYFLYQRF